MLTAESSSVVPFTRPQKQFAADRTAVEKLVNVLFRYADPDTFLSLRAFDDIDDNRPALFIDPVSLGSSTLIDRVCDRIAQTANYQKPHVFCPPICTFKTVDNGKEENIAEGICLTVECDAAPNNARAKLTEILGPATAIVFSGGIWTNPETGEVEDRLHLHWRLKEPVVDAVGFEQLKEARRLAAELVGSDHSSITIVHPLRWPGSWHRKAQPKLARIETNPDAEIELSFALERLRELQPQPTQRDAPRHNSGQARAPLHEVEAALAVLPNSNLEWEDWNRVGMATWNATGGCGFTAFDKWSAKSTKYNAANTAARWAHYSSSPPNRVGAGTIFYEADRLAPGWRDQSAKAEEADTASTASEQPKPTNLNEWDAGDDTETPSPREWLLGNIFCRCFLSSLFGDGAVGKSALRYAQLISLAIGRSLTGDHVFQRCRVLIVSLEDDERELRRRILATLLHHKIDRSEVKGWLFLSAPGAAAGKLMTADRRGQLSRGALADNLETTIVARKIDIVSLDPFVKTHAVEENSNTPIDNVTQVLTDIAAKHNISVDSPHHTSKGLAEPGNADRGRGASSMKDGGRLVYTLTTMSTDEAKLFNISEDQRKSYIRMDSAKVNITKASGEAKWFRLIGVRLGNATAQYPNGDEVQTVEPWNPPDVWAGISGHLLHRILDEIDAGLPDGNRYSDASKANERAAWKVVQKHAPNKNETQAREIIKTWVKNGVLIGYDYENPVTRKSVRGLRVDPGKRPS
jgi:hypothetical protein